MPVTIQYRLPRTYDREPSSDVATFTPMSDILEHSRTLEALPTTALEDVHPHALDQTITFDEPTHTYSVQWKTQEFESSGSLSVSALYSQYFPKFDPNQALKSMRSDNRKRKYLGLTDKEILKQWEDSGTLAANIGSFCHLTLECFFNQSVDIRASPFNTFKVFQQFLEWFDMKSPRWVPFRTEFKMRSTAAERFTGMADMLFVDPCSTPPTLYLKMVDWKFSKEIVMASRFGMANDVCHGLPDCNFSKYSLQQNLYKYMLETYYPVWTFAGQAFTKVSVIEMTLLVLHDNQKSFQEIRIPDLGHIIVEIIRSRRLDVLKVSVV